MSININNKPESTSNISVNGGNVKLNIINEGSAKSHLEVNGGNGIINVTHTESAVSVFNGFIYSALIFAVIILVAFKTYKFLINKKQEKLNKIKNLEIKMSDFKTKKEQIITILNANFFSTNLKDKVYSLLEYLEKEFVYDKKETLVKLDTLIEKLKLEKKEDERFSETLRYVDLVKQVKN